MTRLTKAQIAERAEAIESLRQLCPPGTRVYTVLRHVSQSGMMRHVDAYVIADNAPRWISGLIHTARIGDGQANDGSVKMAGCGTDMGFDLVYRLGATLYPDGFACLGERCPSNDHSNYRGDRKADCPTHHTSGGYALTQSWI